MNEWIKRFILGASLILFAGIVFYVVAPKWQYTVDAQGGLSHRYNLITGGVWAITNERGSGEKVIAKMVRVSLASNALEYFDMMGKSKALKEVEQDPTVYKANIGESESISVDDFLKEGEKK